MNNYNICFSDFQQRFEDAMIKYKIDCPYLAKVFIIIPASCSFPPPGSQFAGEEHIGPLEPVVLGFRKFFLQLYRITTSKGQVILKYMYHTCDAFLIFAVDILQSPCIRNFPIYSIHFSDISLISHACLQRTTCTNYSLLIHGCFIHLFRLPNPVAYPGCLNGVGCFNLTPFC